MMANRIGRLELLFWFVASIIGCGIMLGIVSAIANIPLEPGRTRYPWSQALWFVISSIVILKAMVSRLHDIGKTGLAVLLMFVPLVNLVALLLLMIVPGQKSANAYGEPAGFLHRLQKTGNSQVPN
jgi:uncharacterized membrane protein YhaH (DUF805 family)